MIEPEVAPTFTVQLLNGCNGRSLCVHAVVSLPLQLRTQTPAAASVQAHHH
jgi:hypothetical protein